MTTQTKTKHTPGRWYFRPEEPSIEAEHSDNPGFFVTVADCGKSRTLSDDQMKANAHLIAAAPELLHALDEAAQQAQYIVDNHDDLKRQGADLQKAAITIRELCDAAIAKARGEA